MVAEFREELSNGRKLLFKTEGEPCPGLSASLGHAFDLAFIRTKIDFRSGPAGLASHRFGSERATTRTASKNLSNRRLSFPGHAWA